jgi:hypothetical protein
MENDLHNTQLEREREKISNLSQQSPNSSPSSSTDSVSDGTAVDGLEIKIRDLRRRLIELTDAGKFNDDLNLLMGTG